MEVDGEEAQKGEKEKETKPIVQTLKIDVYRNKFV